MLNRRLYMKLRGLERGLSRLSKNSLEGRVQMTIAREGWMERIVRLRFNNERPRTYPSPKWKARKKSYPWPILHKSGALQRSAENAAFGTYRVRGRVQFNIGRVIHYGQYHQMGEGRLPRRAFYNNPDVKELGPANRRAMNLVAKEIRKALRS